MNHIQQFINSITVPNTLKVIKSVLNNADENIENYNLEELEKFILDRAPSSPKEITTICYVIGLYGRWLQEHNIGTNDLYTLSGKIDKKELWKCAKPTAKNKFLSHDQYEKVIADILKYEPYNPIYYRSLLRCIYEGIYNNDMSVLKNLRGININNNMTILNEDNGNSYKFQISPSLTHELQELAETSMWERPNRFGLCQVNMKGLYPDSIFKIESRNKAKNMDSDETYKFSYYAKLRKISYEYIGYSVLPFHIYISGLMYRIKERLTFHKITLQDAFSDHSKNKTAYEIIKKELIRCNYSSDIGNFREIVKGHLDFF